MTYPFPLSEARWLEPPADDHYPECWLEGGDPFYSCVDCGNIFRKHKGTANQCPECLGFGRKYDECSCDRLERNY